MVLGENVQVTVEKDEIVIRCKASHRGGKSATGKTVRVASTEGNKALTVGNEQVYLGLNLYVK